jgi:hypothetical protein
MRSFSTFVIVSFATLFAAFSTPTFAEQSLAAAGVYIGAGITPIIIAGHGNSEVDAGASLTLGYRLNNNFALETNYVGFVAPFVTGQIIDLNVKGFLPITPKFSVFGKLGAAYFRADASLDFFFFHSRATRIIYAPEVGAGLDYNFTPNFSAELGLAVLPIESNLVAMPATLGLRYTFG